MYHKSSVVMPEIDYCLSTELIDREPVIDIQNLKVKIPVMEDTIGVHQEDASLCKKILNLFDEDGKAIEKVDYREDFLFLEHEGNYTYSFTLANRPELTSSTYDLKVNLCAQNPFYCYEKPQNSTNHSDSSNTTQRNSTDQTAIEPIPAIQSVDAKGVATILWNVEM
jgi:hypothetical protein